MGQHKCYKCTSVCQFKEEKGKLFGFPCDFCKMVVCSDCVKLLAQEIRCVPSQSRAMIFLCPDCLKAIPKMKEDLTKAQQEIRSLKEDLSKTYDESQKTSKNTMKLKNDIESYKVSWETQLKEQVETTTEFKENLAKISKDIAEIKQQLPKTSYAEVLKNLEEKVENISSTPNQTNHITESWLEPTLMELKDREIRAKNILVFGVEESKKKEWQDRKDEDLENILKIFEKMELDLPKDSEIIRLGRFVEGKKRPIKVVFSSQEEALTVLRKRSAVVENGMYIKSDQTLQQRKYLKEVIEKLEEEKRRGKHGLKIKYVRGVPTIIAEKSKN